MKIKELTVQDHLQFVRKSCHSIQKNLPDELQKPHNTQLLNQHYVVNELFSILMIELQPLNNYEIYIKKCLKKIDVILNKLYFIVKSENKENRYIIANHIFNFFEDNYLINFIYTQDYFIHFYYYYIHVIHLFYLIYHDPIFLEIYQSILHDMCSSP